MFERMIARMIDRRVLLAAAAALVVTTLAARAETIPYSAEALAAAQSAGKPVLVEISAPWCPVCKAQKPIISALQEKPEFAGLVVVEVDFDSQKDVVRSLGARSQSTLIAFRGATETDRSVGVTDPAAIEAMVATAFGD